MTSTTLDKRFAMRAGGVALEAAVRYNLAAEKNAREAQQEVAAANRQVPLSVPGRAEGSTPIAAAAPSGERCPYAPLIRQVWGPEASWAIDIAWRESNCRPEVTSPHGAQGLFQLMPLHAQRYRNVGCDPSQWSVPECNVRAAFNLFQASGRGPWHL